MKGHFMEVFPNKPTPKTKKKARKAKAKPTHQLRLGTIHQVKMKPNTRGAAASTHHQALHMCALWHEVTIVLAQVIVMMSYLLMIKLYNKILNMLKFALANKRK
jgi:hypothetical protein